ncbi:MAG: class I SAM-dependent rRNA methyltransferase [Chlorobi bacterium]|nr:class I SAM-dependent rRNA methyltransferase [Chlorobiota bacterium]
MRTKIVLRSGKDQSLRRYHPWVFSGAIKKIYGPLSEGDVVDVEDNKGEFLGMGHYAPGSIAIRIISFSRVDADRDFWKQRFVAAYLMRKEMKLAGNPETNAWRLVYGEGDLLPGLIIDYYAGMLVMQFHSVGMYRQRERFAELLREIMGDEIIGIYDKSAATLPFKADIKPRDEWLYGKKQKEAEVLEYGNHFLVNWTEGQKTGFFLDQRENRKLIRRLSKGKEVLNLFGYTGGFSVYALRGGASHVDTVDSSRKAIDLSKINAEINFGKDAPHRGIVADAFDYLEKSGNNYDLIILDPPAFAKHNNVLPNALQGYKRLNEKAFRKIRPGGIIMTFSCSQVVSRENFRKSVFVAAANAGREVKILFQLSQPPDHPVNIFHPEGEYLKGLVLRVG